MAASTLSILRGVGEAMGLLGAFAFKASSNKFGVLQVGLFAIWLQAVTLSFGVIGDVFVRNSFHHFNRVN